MVARAGGYYAPPFKGYRSVTQGDPLSPTILNLAVYAIIRHWVTVVAAMDAGAEGLGILIQDLSAYFYADDVLVTSTQMMRLQRAFNVLTDLFDRVVLRTNTCKTMSMV